MRVINTIKEIREQVNNLKNSQEKYVLVPTMGYLHFGHLELIKTAKRYCQTVIVSIFVNPLQFGPKEDYANYPRDHKRDIELCLDAGVSILFLPESSELIPDTPLITINNNVLDRHLCGASRPNHFNGVCTIVAKLFNIIQPNFAIFGKKDIQQLKIIQQMVKDLNYEVEIIGVDTVRDNDGLALSSRNKYLNKDERNSALIIPKLINSIASMIEQNQLSTKQILEKAKFLVEQEPLASIDYIEITDTILLQPIENLDQPLIIAVAIFIGKTRLIDNRILERQIKDN